MTREEKLLSSPTYLMYLKNLFHGGKFEELEQIRTQIPGLTYEGINERLNQFFEDLEKKREEQKLKKLQKKQQKQEKLRKYNLWQQNYEKLLDRNRVLL